MYRAIRLFAGTALVALVACSNDTEMPSQYHRGLLAQPTDVQAGVEGGGRERVLADGHRGECRRFRRQLHGRQRRHGD